MSPKTLDPVKPNHRIRLFVLLGCAFALKFVVLVQLRDNPLIQPDAGLDTTAYVTLANKVTGGDLALGPGLYYVSPFYIYFLALGLEVFTSFTMVRVVQIALGTASVGLIFAMARDWFGERAAWIAAVLAAFTGLFTFYDILILQSSVDAFLTSAALYALTRAVAPYAAQTFRSPRDVPAVIAGIIFGLQTLNRPNVLIAAIGIAVVALAARRVRLAALLVSGMIVGMAPVAIRNLVVSHEWTFVSSHGGLNFYIGNNEKATGFYQLVPGVSPTIVGQQSDVRRVASRALGRDVTDAEASDYFFNLGRTWIAEHPVAAVVLFAKKFVFVFNAVHVPLPQSYPFYAYDLHTALRFYAIGPWLLGPLGLTGLLLCAPRQSRRSAEGAKAARAFVIWASFVPLYAASVALFFIADRYRLPVLVPLCVTGGAALDAVLGALPALRARRRASSLQPPVSDLQPARAAAILLSAAAVAIPVNWRLEVTEGRWLEGLRLIEQLAIHHRYDEAASWATRLDADHPPHPGAAHYGLGAQLLQLNEEQRALPFLEEAARDDPDSPQSQYAYGQALLRTRGAAAALPYLKRGFEGGIELPLGGFDYAVALSAAGDPRGASDALRRITLPDSANAEIWLKAARLAAEVGQPAMAEPFFRHAVELSPDSAAAHQQYGLNLLILQRYEDAARELTDAIRFDPKDPDSLAHLAYCEAKLGRADTARLHAQAALAIDPSNQLARQLIALLRQSS